jgi:hypothetical protein
MTHKGGLRYSKQNLISLLELSNQLLVSCLSYNFYTRTKLATIFNQSTS